MTDIEKTCSCFGHTEVDITDKLRADVKKAVDDAVAEGFRIFLFGGRSDFDDLVYDIVSDVKAQHTDIDIKRVFCFPLDRDLYRPPRWFQKKQYESLECPPKSFDYWYPSLYYRNCAMIDKSDLVLFYAEQRENSGAYKALEYAQKIHKRLINFI